MGSWRPGKVAREYLAEKKEEEEAARAFRKKSHENGPCRCATFCPSGRLYMGYEACLVCWRLSDRKKR